MDHAFNPSLTVARTSVRTSTRGINLTSFWAALERDRFGMTPVFLVLAACLGGFAAAVTVQYSLLMLSIVGLSTGLVEVLLIAVAPMRVTFWFLVAAVVIDLLVFFF
jgi:hypothetical protein